MNKYKIIGQMPESVQEHLGQSMEYLTEAFWLEVNDTAGAYVDEMKDLHQRLLKMRDNLAAKWEGKRTAKHGDLSQHMPVLDYAKDYKDELAKEFFYFEARNVKPKKSSTNYGDTVEMSNFWAKHLRDGKRDSKPDNESSVGYAMQLIEYAEDEIRNIRPSSIAKTRARQWEHERKSVEEAIMVACTVFQQIKSSIRTEVMEICQSSELSEQMNEELNDAASQMLGGVKPGLDGEAIPEDMPTSMGAHNLSLQCGYCFFTPIFELNDAFTDFNRHPNVVPYMVDLMKYGGFISDSGPSINSFVLRLLHMLPAGALSIQLYDPRAASSITSYFIQENTRRQIFGENVLRSEAELRDLLVNTEMHMATVNKLYLSKGVANLLEYNRKAETQQPYCLIIIYDDISKWDVELAGKLRRIVDTGANCGVFVIIKNLPTNNIGIPLPILSEQWFYPDTAMTEPPLQNSAARDMIVDINPVTRIINAFMKLDIEQLMNAGNLESIADLALVSWWQPISDDDIKPGGVEAIVKQLEKEFRSEAPVVSPAAMRARNTTASNIQKPATTKSDLFVQAFSSQGQGIAGWSKEAIQLCRQQRGDLSLILPIGNTRDGEPVCVRMEQQSAGNTLVCVGADGVYTDCMSALILAGAVAGATVMLCDYGQDAFSRAFNKYASYLSARNSSKFQVFYRDDITKNLHTLGGYMQRVNNGESRLKAPMMVVAAGIEHQDAGQETILNRLVLNGPAMGVHFVVGCRGAGPVQGALGGTNEFSAIVAGSCSADDYTELNLPAPEENGLVRVAHRDNNRLVQAYPYGLETFPLK